MQPIGKPKRGVGAPKQAKRSSGSRVRPPAALLVGIVGATCLGWVLAPASWAAEEPSSTYDKAGVEHNEQCIKTTENKRAVVRGVNGNQLQAAGGAVTDPPEAKETCKSGAGIRFQGIEAVKAKGMTMYYTWPFEKGEQSPGFVWLYELASAPSVNIAYAHGNGASAPLGTEPDYKITPEKIESEQGYQGGETWYTYSVYGLPVGGAKFALMTWSWINVGDGGIARAAVEEGETFYAADVRPITEESDNKAGTADGTVTARYGMVNSGEKLVWGWMVTSHTFNGICYNHMSYAGGGTPLPESLCPAATTTAPSGVASQQATLNGSVTPNGTDTHYYFQYGTAPCTPTACGSTQPTPPGTDAGSTGSPTASTTVTGLLPGTTYHFRLVASNSVGTKYGGEESFTTPNRPPVVATWGTENVLPEQATIRGSVIPEGIPTTYHFEYGTTKGSYGSSIPVPEGEAGSGRTEVDVNATPTHLEASTTYYYRLVATNSAGTEEGGEQAFTTQPVNQYLAYRSADNSIWQWWYTAGSAWNNSKLGGEATGTPSIAVDSLGNQFIAYRDAKGDIWQLWRPIGQEWRGPAELAHEAAAGNPTMVVGPTGNQYITYRGKNNAIWQLWWAAGGEWHNSELPMEHEGKAEGDPTMTVDAGGEQYVAYRGEKGAIWQLWRPNQQEWHDSKLGGEAQGNPMMVVGPTGNQYITYRGANNAIWQWWWSSGAGWHDSELPMEHEGKAASDPSMTVDAGGNQYVSYRAESGAIWELWRPNEQEWHDSKLGGEAFGKPTMVVASNGYQYITYRAVNSQIWEWSYKTGVGWENNQHNNPTLEAVSEPSMAIPAGQ
jgi:hypothetical protein